MAVVPTASQLAQERIRDAQARTKDAHQKYDDESIRVRESSDKFYGSLALFSGGTIALSITYLGYLRNTPGRTILYPRVLIAAWIVLLACAVTSIFCPLLNSYYAHFSRLGIYVGKLAELKQTLAEEMDNPYLIVGNTPQDRQEEKVRLTGEAETRKQDREWAKKREFVSNMLWTGFGWTARLAFPIGLGLLMFFAAKNM